MNNSFNKVKRSLIWDIPEDTLRKIIEDAESLSDVLKHFGLLGAGGNYKTLRNRCLQDNIDLSELNLAGTDKKNIRIV